MIITDPYIDHQPINETTYVNIPVIAFCDTNSLIRNVDIVIPANNKGKNSIGVLYYLLTRMVLQMKGHLIPFTHKDTREYVRHAVVDLFINIEYKEVKKKSGVL